MVTSSHPNGGYVPSDARCSERRSDARAPARKPGGAGYAGQFQMISSSAIQPELCRKSKDQSHSNGCKKRAAAHPHCLPFQTRIHFIMSLPLS